MADDSTHCVENSETFAPSLEETNETETSVRSSETSVRDETGDSCKNDSLRSCSFCNEEFELTDLYRCVTCQIYVDKIECENHIPASDVATENFNCEVCIVSSHLRKKHEIVDHKGYKPTVCGKHKTIARLFCRDCKLVFCSSCIINHRRHDFVSVAEESLETRKKVFDYLSELEVLIKPLKHQEDVAKRSMEEVSKTLDSLSSENFANTLCTALEKLVRTNASELQGVLLQRTDLLGLQVPPSSKEILDSATRMNEANENSIKKLNCLLQVSDGNCVQCFSEVERMTQKVLEDQSLCQNSHVHLSWSPEIGHIIFHFLQDVLRSIITPKIESIDFKNMNLKSVDFKKAEKRFDWSKVPYRAPEKCLDVSLSVSELFDVSHKEDSVHFWRLIRIQNEQTYVIESYCFYNCRIQKVLNYQLFVAFFTSDKRIFIYCLQTNNFFS